MSVAVVSFAEYRVPVPAPLFYFSFKCKGHIRNKYVCSLFAQFLTTVLFMSVCIVILIHFKSFRQYEMIYLMFVSLFSA
jgi:hypothetical protein